jgi:hypothetical protein
MLAAPVLLGGCGLHDPYAQGSRPPAPVPAVAPAPQAPATPPGAGASGVLARYATVWVNWSGAALDRQRAALLTLVAGALAGELRRDTAEAAKTQLLQVSNAYSRGRYVGAIPQAGQEALVVTFEEVAPLGGEAQAAYHLYLAHTARTAQGWRVTQWQPLTDG